MQKGYDFSQGVRGKYAAAVAEGTNLIKLDEDVAKVFRNSKQVNDLLRSIIQKQQLSGDQDSVA